MDTPYPYTVFPDKSFLPLKWPCYWSRRNPVSKYAFKNNELNSGLKSRRVIDGRPIIFIMRPLAS